MGSRRRNPNSGSEGTRRGDPTTAICNRILTSADVPYHPCLISILSIPEMPNTNAFGELKRICETELGIYFQCYLTKHVFRMGKLYLANVAVKINVKSGGQTLFSWMIFLGAFLIGFPLYLESYNASRIVPMSRSSSSSQPVSCAWERASSTPPKGGTSKAINAPFRCTSPGLMNGMQIPARTTSPMPNLDVQKHEQLQYYGGPCMEGELLNKKDLSSKSLAKHAVLH